MQGVKRNARARRSRPVLPPLSPTRSTRGTGGRPKRLVYARRERLAVRLRKALTAQSALLPDSDGAAGGAGLGRRDGGATLQRNSGTADQTNRSRSSQVLRARNCPHVEGSAVELNFTSPRELFTSLIAPLTEEEFFSRYWEREPLLIKRSCPATSSPYTTLFSLATLRNLVQETPVKFGRHVNVCCYKRGRKRSYGEAGEALTAALLDRLWREKKATVQFFQPQQFQDELWHMLSLLETYFGCLVGSNVYLTPSGSQGLAPHYDDVEVFILQLEGSKEWCLYPPSSPLPHCPSPDLSPDAIGTPSHDLVLEAGDILYFPRGTIHHARTPSSTPHSTHITISTYQQNSWADLLSNTLVSAIHQLSATDLQYRTGLPLNLIVQNSSSASTSSSETEKLADGVKTEELTNTTTERLRGMGERVLEHVCQRHQSLISEQHLSFLTARLPPFARDHGPEDPAPSSDCTVRLKWPDHVLAVTEMRTPDGLRGRGVVPGVQEGREEVIVYHSLANERAQHMIVPEGGPPQPHGVRLPVHYLPALSLLLSSSSPVPASSLPLPSEDTRVMLLSLWVEGLLHVS